MKKHINSLLLCLLLLTGCSSGSDQDQTGIALLVDVTSGCENRRLVSEGGLAEAIGMTEGSSFGHAVKAQVTQITGVALQPVQAFRLAAKSALANPHVHEQEVSDFLATVVAAIRDSSQGCVPTKQSSIYKPFKTICESMVADSSLSQRVVVLISDGFENAEVSMLKERRFVTQPETMIEKLEARYGALPDLHGFQFILVHQPAEGSGIEGIEFWQTMLEAKGAKTRLQATF